MNTLSLKEKARILHMLVEGNSLRATARMAEAGDHMINASNYEPTTPKPDTKN